MSIPRLALTVALLTLPSTASAQAWADAYKAGDYKKAADLLHPLVIQLATLPGGPQEPDPPRHLAIMYAEGRGVPKDPIAACLMAQVASVASRSPTATFGQDSAAYDASVKEADGFLSHHCDRLNEWDRTVAANWCFAFGMPEAVLTVGTDAVRVGRGGIQLADAMPERPDQIIGCPMLIARLRPLTIAPPADARRASSRGICRLLFWRPIHSGVTRRGLHQWNCSSPGTQARDGDMEEQLETSDGWPNQHCLSLAGRLILEIFDRQCALEWDGAPPRRGGSRSPRSGR